MSGLARNIIAVIVGYVVFAALSLLFFALAHIEPHSEISGGNIFLVIVVGAVIALIGGVCTRLIQSSKSLSPAYSLAALIAVIALVSMMTSSGSRFTQIAAILLFAPVSIVGNLLVGRPRSV